MENRIAADAANKKMEGAPAWEIHLEDIIQEALDVVSSRGGNTLQARSAAVEALINTAAKFHVHDVEPFDAMGEDIPGAIDDALEDFATQARVALRGELVAHGLMDPAA